MYISLRNTPGPTTGRNRGRNRGRVSSIVITLGIVSLLTDVASESVSAILPIYITAAIGLSTVAYGFIDGLYQGVSALVRIGGGWVADRQQQPKWVAFFGYGISAVARGGLLIATGFGALTAVVTLDRIGKGVRTAPRDAMIAAASEEASLGRSFGVHRMLDTVGAALGPLLAFVILFVIPHGYTAVFAVSLAFALAGLAVLGLMVPDMRSAPRAAAARTTAASTAQESTAAAPRFRWRQLNDPALRRLLIAAGLFGLLTIGDGFIYLVLQSRDAFATEWFPLLYVGTNITFLAFAVPAGRIADRFGRARMFVIGHLVLLGAYVVAALPATGPVPTVACLLLLGAFYASTDGILAALAAQHTPPTARATGIAAAQTVVALTRLVASTGFGLLWFMLGRETAMVIAAGALALVLPAVAALLWAPPHAPHDDAAGAAE
ncbi:MFS transporter [Ruicaihuangia caeni]|uniref:MFS transporter n=1 Tax=Ruicaihuangia caeni TaxID=3042517 RepID=A0AAW6T2R7_9MICO|nr:MFS transporter [Klugiella sp. YN-L-19]MDI2097614.1 MFS transporter [Klugiella sp. YN-L-19]